MEKKLVWTRGSLMEPISELRWINPPEPMILTPEQERYYEEENQRYAKWYEEYKKGKPYFVYVMKDEVLGFLKIGFSDNPEYREKTLQAQRPIITLIHVFKHYDMRMTKWIERRLHKELAHKRIRGEWFDVTLDEIIARHDLKPPYDVLDYGK